MADNGWLYPAVRYERDTSIILLNLYSIVGLDWPCPYIEFSRVYRASRCSTHQALVYYSLVRDIIASL
jgi:hypothetical protein